MRHVEAFMDQVAWSLPILEASTSTQASQHAPRQAPRTRLPMLICEGPVNLVLVGYMRVSKADGSQTTDLQRDALTAAGVEADAVYEDRASGAMDYRPQLAACLKALRSGDTLMVWKLDRLGRNLGGNSNSLSAHRRTRQVGRNGFRGE